VWLAGRHSWMVMVTKQITIFLPLALFLRRQKNEIKENAFHWDGQVLAFQIRTKFLLGTLKKKKRKAITLIKKVLFSGSRGTEYTARTGRQGGDRVNIHRCQRPDSIVTLGVSQEGTRWLRVKPERKSSLHSLWYHLNFEPQKWVFHQFKCVFYWFKT